MLKLLLGILFLSSTSCIQVSCTPKPAPTSLSVFSSNVAKDTTVYVSFGADSALTASDWEFCTGTALSCSFPLKKQTEFPLPNPSGKYINATFSFDAAVGCGSTKAEVNINNPAWYDTLDVSLVDGYNLPVKIRVSSPAAGLDAASSVTLGPPNGAQGNEKVYGLFPLGCDICTARQAPPCGMTPGTGGCKTGSQYKPDVPCQWQGTTKGGGNAAVKIVLD